MRKFSILLTAFLLFVIAASYAQHPCSTDEYNRDVLLHHPFTAGTHITNLSAAKTTSGTDTGRYTIPLVVHVIHDYGAENLSDDVIFSYVPQWNLALMGENADTADVIPTFKPYVGCPRVQLKLATKDPAGHPTKGIVRMQSYLTDTGNDQAKFNQWPQDKYTNVWIINNVSGAIAYSFFPATVLYGIPYYDGIVCNAAEANYMQTIPHEMGHYLNLHHVWGDIGCGMDCSATDSVDDTPPTKGHLVTFCTAASLNDTNCATNYMVHYLSSLGTDSVYDYPDTANAQNFMDYTYCPKMFTKGQAARMRAALNNAMGNRDHLVTSANLAATGALDPRPDLPPVADYIVDTATGGGPISDKRSYFLTFNNPASFRFRNASWNDTLSSVSWSFTGGASLPTSTSMTTVDNRFSIPGWVSVSLTANSNAGSNTITNAHAVYAADTTPAGGPGYMQNFTSATAIGNWPMFNYYNNPFKWEFYTGAGMGDNTCIRYRSYDTTSLYTLARTTGTATGDVDDFFTPAFNISGVTGNLYFNFFTTGAATTSGIPSWVYTNTDTLEVYASISGGTMWNRIAQFGGNNLANNGTMSTEFTPSTSTSWIPRSVSIPAVFRTRQTFFRLRYRPGNTGNNLYLDKMSIGTSTAGVQEALNSTQASFSIFPNPSSAGCSIVFRTGNDGMVNYSIKDITGKLVLETSKTFTPNSIEQEPIGRSVLPVAGMYFVTVNIDGISTTQKLVVY